MTKLAKAITVQLKKNNFLDTVTEVPMTRGELVEALDGFDFIDSWLTFLIDHFEAQGKIVKATHIVDDVEVTTFARKGKKGAAGARKAFLVEQAEDNSYSILEKDLEAGEVLDKDGGWGTTKAKAVKNATSAIFQQYLANVATVKELLIEVEGGADAE